MNRIPAGHIAGWAFGACVLIWGGSWLAVRAAVDGADPIGIAALRTALAFLVLAGIALALRRSLPSLQQALRAMLIGTVLIGVNFALVYTSAPMLPSGLAALLYATTPLQAALLAPLAGVGDRATSRQTGGMLLGIAGVAVGLGAFGAGSAPWVAVGLVLVAATTSAGGTLMARRWQAADAIWTNVFANLAAAVVLSAVYALGDRGPVVPTGPAAWAGFAYMLFGGSLAGFLLYFVVVQQWDAARASFTTVLTPFVALASGAAVAQEPLPSQAVAGAVLVAAAGWLVLARPRASAKPLSAA